MILIENLPLARKWTIDDGVFIMNTNYLVIQTGVRLLIDSVVGEGVGLMGLFQVL